MPWFKCTDRTFNFKVQYINEFLAQQLVRDMEGRGQGFELDAEYSKLQDSVHFELGGYGMYAMNQPRHTFDLGGNLLEVDDAQAHEWMLKLREAKVRTFDDGTEYIKLYSRFCCLILTTTEQKSLLSQLGDAFEAMNKASDDFLEEFNKAWYKDGEPPILRLQDIQKDKGPAN